MNRRDDIQMLIPETHRDLIEAVPRGFPKSAATGALLLGATGGALVTMIVADWAGWITVAAFASLLLGQRMWVAISNRSFDEQIADLEARGLEWKDNEDS